MTHGRHRAYATGMRRVVRWVLVIIVLVLIFYAILYLNYRLINVRTD